MYLNRRLIIDSRQQLSYFTRKTGIGFPEAVPLDLSYRSVITITNTFYQDGRLSLGYGSSSGRDISVSEALAAIKRDAPIDTIDTLFTFLKFHRKFKAFKEYTNLAIEKSSHKIGRAHV